MFPTARFPNRESLSLSDAFFDRTISFSSILLNKSSLIRLRMSFERRMWCMSPRSSGSWPICKRTYRTATLPSDENLQIFALSMLHRAYSSIWIGTAWILHWQDHQEYKFSKVLLRFRKIAGRHRFYIPFGIRLGQWF